MPGNPRAIPFGVIRKFVKQIQYTDLAGSSAQVLSVGKLPRGAVVLAHEVNLAAQFVGGSISSVTLKLGGTVDNSIIIGFPMKASTVGVYSPGETHSGGHGSHVVGNYSGQELVATVTPVGDSMSNLTAGDLTITVWYTVLA